MKIIYSIGVVLAFSFFSCGTSDKTEIELQAEKIVSQMTLAEKVGQMAQVSIEPMLIDGTDQLNMEKLRDAIVNYHVGSMLNVPLSEAQTPQFFYSFVKQIQDVSINETRMKIPLVYALDQIHGGTYTAGATLFPHQIALAATWNPHYARKMGEITAYETRASNVAWNFSPVLDLGTDPRFSRQYEGFGEDPYIGAVFGRELVKGNEGEDNNIGDRHKVASCIKHFVGYGAPISGKDRTPAYIPKDVLYEYHLPAFKAGIEAGAHTLMVNSGIINNVPVHASYDLLTNVLRKELGFRGVVVTDWEDIDKLHTRDHLTPSSKEAIKIGINAGIDMVMVPYDYRTFCTNLIELVQEGEISEKRIDESVARIIALKLKLDLFNTPNTDYKDYPLFASQEFAKESYDAAAEAITLLKNKDNILPLKQDVKLLITGPNAVSRRALNGGWSVSWQGHLIEKYPERCPNILEAMSKEFGEKNVKYVPGVNYKNNEVEYDTEYKDRFDEAIAAARGVDYVIVCVGENSYCEKPGDLDDLYLNDLQTELILELRKTGKKIIVVLNEGRPRIISKFASTVDAIVQTYLPGPYGAQALTDIISGKVNPSGKLPYTYPAFPNSLIPYYHKYAEEQKKSEGVYNYEGDYYPEYHFGYGLSYTTFKYSNGSINVDHLSKKSKDNIVITVDVTNTGDRAGKETVQLYSSDLYSSLIPDTKRLRRFEKLSIEPGETKTITFTLTLDDLAFYDFDCKRTIEPGDFELHIAAASNDIKQSIKFKINE